MRSEFERMELCTNYCTTVYLHMIVRCYNSRETSLREKIRLIRIIA
jgi:hypothetical protein